MTKRKIIIRLFWTLVANAIGILCVMAMYLLPEQLSFLKDTKASYNQHATPLSFVLCFLPIFIVPFIWFPEVFRERTITDWFKRIMLVLLLLLQAVICIIYLVWLGSNPIIVSQKSCPKTRAAYLFDNTQHYSVATFKSLFLIIT